MIPYNAFEFIASAAAAVEPYVVYRNELSDDWISELTVEQRAALDRFLETLDIAAFRGKRELNAYYGA